MSQAIGKMVFTMAVVAPLVGFTVIGCAGGKVQLSDVAAAACEGQAGANVAGEVGLALGQPEVVAAASVASVGLGLACKW